MSLLELWRLQGAMPLTWSSPPADDGSVGTPYDQRRELVEVTFVRGAVEACPAVVWAADSDDDPWSEETWATAVPRYPSRAFMQLIKLRLIQWLKLFPRLHPASGVSLRGFDQQAAVMRWSLIRRGRQAGGLTWQRSDPHSLVWLFPGDDGTYQTSAPLLLPGYCTA